MVNLIMYYIPFQKKTEIKYNQMKAAIPLLAASSEGEYGSEYKFL